MSDPQSEKVERMRALLERALPVLSECENAYVVAATLADDIREELGK